MSILEKRGKEKMKSYITKKQFQELKEFAARHGLLDEKELFEVIKLLSYEEARNAIIGYATCQGVA